jgi:predicted ATPase
MDAKQPSFLKSITLQGFLSYGPLASAVLLSPLSVVIGPNGSGKSNLVEALSILRAVPRDLPKPISKGGRVKDWLWNDGANASSEAKIEVVIAEGQMAKFASNGDNQSLRYELTFGSQGDRFIVLDERVENELPTLGHSKPDFYFRYERGKPVLNQKDGQVRELQRADIDPTQSILSQVRDPGSLPQLSRLGDLLKRILIYRNWHFGPEAAVREASALAAPNDTLSETFDNLAARLAVLMGRPAVKRRLLELLADLAPGFDDLNVVPEGGALALYLVEGNRSIPARRLSDGTLRYLCLLSILLAPEASPLIVIEEPELGLHPDMMPTLRDLLLEASKTTQVVVTTHSTQLADAMTDFADSVLVCEKKAGPSRICRLSQPEVDRHREHGGLGTQWMSGLHGGTRW